MGELLWVKEFIFLTPKSIGMKKSLIIKIKGFVFVFVFSKMIYSSLFIVDSFVHNTLLHLGSQIIQLKANLSDYSGLARKRKCELY